MSEKVYPVTPEWSKRAHIDNARYLEMYAASIKDPVKFWGEEGKRIRGITAECLAMLTHYDWPGNVRQLENAVFRAVVLADGDELTVAEFPQIAAQVNGFEETLMKLLPADKVAEFMTVLEEWKANPPV